MDRHVTDSGILKREVKLHTILRNRCLKLLIQTKVLMTSMFFNCTRCTSKEFPFIRYIKTNSRYAPA